MTESEQPKKQNIPVISNNGDCLFEDSISLDRAVQFVINTKLAPESLIKCGKQAVASALLLCKQHNLPQKALNQMCYVRGKIQVYGSLLTAIAMKSKNFSDMKTLYINTEGEVISYENKNLKSEVFAAVCLIKKNKQEDYKEYFFTMDEAKAAGLTRSPTWSSYKKDMLFHRAKMRALTQEFPDVLEGIQLAESLEPEEIEEIDKQEKTIESIEEKILINKDDI